ncbi:MAG TPA: aspartate-semialdehyde dehydrogenase [Opitutaceae bacterium]|nr:aspartate-semialdehyde dehydrogenase [Opitutaceae bacterium]
MKKAYNVGIVGATGAVGQELIRLLEMRGFPVGEIRLLASARSAGKTVELFGKKVVVQEAKNGAFAGLDLCFFAAGGSVTRAFAKDAVASGCVVIDKSSALRMEPDIPLVVPEINADQLARHKGIIANPNCSTAVTLMGLWPLHQLFTAKRVIISTFQSVSGTGAEAIRELASQVKALQTGAPIVKKVYPYQIAFNCIPQVDTFGPDLYTGEENKMMLESRKIMGLPELRVSATCVRVPVVQAHSISVSAEFEKPVDVVQARAAVAAFPGAELVDDPANRLYPTPLDFTRKVKCGVGRIRKDTAFDNGLSFWVSGDNLWKGAALNAIQVAETLIARDLLRVPAA